MAFAFQTQYPPEIAARVRAFYATLSEKDQRRYAAVEAARLGHGGIAYVAEVLECSTRTIERGLLELDELPHDPAAGRVRRFTAPDGVTTAWMACPRNTARFAAVSFTVTSQSPCSSATAAAKASMRA